MKFGSKSSAHAKTHAGCSVHVNTALYFESVAPVPDRTSVVGRHYFLAGPSTCALAAIRNVCDCEDGIEDIQGHESYAEHHIGEAVTIIEEIFARRGALERFTGYGQEGGDTLPLTPFQAGDVPIIDGPPYGIHVITCTEDVTVSEDGKTWTGQTQQGGQGDGGVMLFASSWHVKPDGRGQPRLFAGDGQRYVVAVGRVGKLGRDTDDTPENVTDNAGPDTVPAAAPGTGDE